MRSTTDISHTWHDGVSVQAYKKQGYDHLLTVSRNGWAGNACNRSGQVCKQSI